MNRFLNQSPNLRASLICSLVYTWNLINSRISLLLALFYLLYMFFEHGVNNRSGSRRVKAECYLGLGTFLVIIQLPLFLTYFSATLNADNFHIDYYKIIARVSLEA